jgi:hypothetical protein
METHVICAPPPAFGPRTLADGFWTVRLPVLVSLVQDVLYENVYRDVPSVCEYIFGIDNRQPAPSLSSRRSEIVAVNTASYSGSEAKTTEGPKQSQNNHTAS